MSKELEGVVSWSLVPLNAVCEIIMGQAPVGASYNENSNGLALIAGAGDFGNLTPIPKKHTTEPSKTSKVDDLILCIRATIGDLNWSDKEYCLGRGVAGLRPIAGKLEKNYLWHFITANKAQLAAKGTGSTFKQVSKSDIAEWKIQLPPLDEQKRIAAILDKADSLRRKRQQAMQLADEFLRAVFLDMFGDPMFNPKNIAVLSMPECFDITTGRLNSNASSETGKYPFFTCAKEVFAIDEYAFDQEALLLAGNNAQADYDVKHYKGKFNAYQRTYVLTLKNKNWSYPFYKFALEYQLQNLKRASKGTSTKYITMEIMGRTMLPAPDADKQNEFVKFFERYQRVNEKNYKYFQESDYLFNSLSQKAFAGEL
ncbi:MAG: restriction endonuclease subunit S [Methylococcales bacterium]|nr:restriction endonuclease subunit S [Methylococcales bacterium]